MAYADLDKVDTLLNGDLYNRNLQELGETCAAKADAKIDAYVSNRYTVPFTVVPEMIASIAQDITIYYLLRTGYFDGIAGNDKETAKEFYDLAIKDLEKIRDGEMNLPDVDPSNTGANAARIASTRGDYHPSMDMGSELDWGTDEDLIEKLEDEKS